MTRYTMYSSISAWMYICLAGLRVDRKHPGFKKFKIKPAFPSGLNSVNAAYDSVQGRIELRWKRMDNTIEYTAKIPAGSEAVFEYDDVRRVLPPGENVVIIKKAESCPRNE